MSVDQTRFRTALLDSAAAVPAGLSDGTGRPAGGRFSVYRNNVAVSLTEALEDSFPVILKLLGEENFRAIMGVFLRAHPPKSPVLARYGADLPAFLEAFPPLAHLPYLADVARLELALIRAYHAADSHPADASILQSLSPDALLQTRFTLAPALELLRSPWPVHAIWRFNSEEAAPKPSPGAQDVLIIRPDFDPEPVLLPPGAAPFIAALREGQPLGPAHDAASEAASEAQAEFDLTQCLSLLLSAKAITDIHSGTTP
ncbi:putative DNA-binding domain-containing protein [Roseovarius nubinhibens]|uniref:HvfC/BufC N-terminal domain-containing protein n=1 Tax=Roseovarius nubinhibens TaxID=314263 RepID=UPI001C0A53FE|nr:DNA-binding domain-containing protein [Roseovarius nubinhibens]MBU3000675.1 putative DNA-binding domain-containing protein [Roseovarius nubinhibens]